MAGKKGQFSTGIFTLENDGRDKKARRWGLETGLTHLFNQEYTLNLQKKEGSLKKIQKSIPLWDVLKK